MMAWGVLAAVNLSTYTASVALADSRPAYLRDVVVSRGIPASELVVGRRAAVWLNDGEGTAPLLLAVW